MVSTMKQQTVIESPKPNSNIMKQLMDKAMLTRQANQSIIKDYRKTFRSIKK